MTKPTYDRTFWEQLWSKTLRERPDKVAHRSPNAQLIAEVVGLRPGRALDAGCGHGADTLWLAAHGWQVTAVDFSASALAHGRATAEAIGADVAQRIAWVEGDLATWTAAPEHYDLVVCLYAVLHDHAPIQCGKLPPMSDLWGRLIALYEEPFFDGPWEGDAELTAAFLAFAARERAELFDEYREVGNAAYCIELLLADEEPEEHGAALAAFVAGLDPALGRRARTLIEEDLARRDDDDAAELLAELRDGH